MADFDVILPTNLIKEFEDLTKNEAKMIEEMTRAGAEVVYNNVVSNVPKNWHTSNIMRCLKITKTYKTPSDGGINTKVAFYGYFINKRGIKTPAPLVANVTEYGATHQSKKPFMRKSFKASEIEKAMLNVQKKYIRGG
jgi:HK97 gp10 family phage protein